MSAAKKRVIQALNQHLSRHVRQIHQLLVAADKLSHSYGEDIDGRRVTITSKRRTVERREDPDLPPVLWDEPDSIRDAYRAVREMRETWPEDKKLNPSDIKEWIERDDIVPDSQPISTLNHALHELKELELAWPHPTRGWVLGREQPRLPFLDRQSDTPSAPELRSYCERMADAGVRRFTSGRPTVSKQRIWVPGEKDEYQRGVVVLTDAATEQLVGVSERTGTMRVPKRLGGLRESAAVHAELLRVEGKYAVVKLPGVTAEFRTRVLGDWQIQGLDAPEPEEAELAGGSA